MQGLEERILDDLVRVEVRDRRVQLPGSINSGRSCGQAHPDHDEQRRAEFRQYPSGDQRRRNERGHEETAKKEQHPHTVKIVARDVRQWGGQIATEQDRTDHVGEKEEERSREITHQIHRETAVINLSFF